MLRHASRRSATAIPRAIKITNTIRNKSTFSHVLESAVKLVTPKALLVNPISLVSKEMNTLAHNITDLIGSGHPVLNRVTGYYFEAEGKKVRPLMVLLISRALSEIPIEQRNRIPIDYKDVPEDPIYSKTPLLFQAPVSSFSPLSILHGIKPLNPLTKGPEPVAADFDKERGILPKQRRLAEIVEMIHTASLLHDDVIDHSDTRRGRPSGNIAFTNKMAVLAGDFLLGRATVAISRLRNPEVVELVSNSIANLVEGEFMQLKNTSIDGDATIIDNGNKKVPPITSKTLPIGHDYQVPTAVTNNSLVTHDQVIDLAFEYYLHKTYLKTAALISKSCRAAAILSGSQNKVIDECYEFGKNVGICFQLVDDMLDFTISSKDLGKPAGADLELGIATAPVLFAWKADPSLGPLIKRNFCEEGDVLKTAEAVKKYNGVEKTRKMALEYKDKAIENLRAALPPSEARTALEMLTNSILSRRK